MSDVIKQSDIRINDHLIVAYASYYGKRKIRVKEYIKIVNESLPVFRKILSIPSDITIRIGGIKGRVRGKYFASEKVAVVDDGVKNSAFLEFLAHELVHAEQYETKKLAHVYHVSRGMIHSWNGSNVFNKGTTYKAYRDQPWEIEAFERQKTIAKQVMQELNWCLI
jgi:hypothetical protein